MKSKITLLLALTFMSISLVSCGGFKAKRVGADESDEKAMEITDNWLAKDTEQAIAFVMKKVGKHKGFKKWLRRYKGGEPKLFIAEVQNRTAEAYFPIDDMNEEFLNALSESGDFVLIDQGARDNILKEMTYQNDGMVDPSTAKSVGKQTGADLMIFGSVYMKPERRKGKTIKQYSVNIRMTDIEKGTEVFRARTKVHKYSEKGSFGL
jgi:penicillin-binding protein activator